MKETCLIIIRWTLDIFYNADSDSLNYIGLTDIQRWLLELIILVIKIVLRAQMALLRLN